MTTNRYPEQMFSKLLVVLAVALSTCAYGFQGPAFCAQRSSHKHICHSRQLVKPRVRNGNFTPLHVSSSATSSNESKTDQKQIIKLEKMIERENKRKEKMSEQVKLAERKMSMLNERKNAYLYGTPVMDNTVTSFKETTARSAVKAMMWRVIAGSVTFITSLRFSGSMKTALSIVGSDFFFEVPHHVYRREADEPIECRQKIGWRRKDQVAYEGSGMENIRHSEHPDGRHFRFQGPFDRLQNCFFRRRHQNSHDVRLRKDLGQSGVGEKLRAGI